MGDPTGIALFSLMKSRMQMLGERQRVIGENVANVSTPHYTPNDIDQDAFAKALAREAAGPAGSSAARPTVMAATRPGHIAPASNGRANVSVVHTPDSETTLDGNSVVVEEQMMKIAETRMDFETMVGLYQKSLGLLKIAARGPR